MSAEFRPELTQLRQALINEAQLLGVTIRPFDVERLAAELVDLDVEDLAAGTLIISGAVLGYAIGRGQRR